MNPITPPLSDRSPNAARPRVHRGRWTRRGLYAAAAAIAGMALLPMLGGASGDANASDAGSGNVAPETTDQPVTWRTDFEAALKESAETNRPVLVDFTASWCPPCKVMEAQVWPNERVAATIEERVIPLKLDVDLPTSAEPAGRYGIQYIPTLLILDSEGSEQARGSFMSAEQMVAFLEKHAAAPTTRPVDGD